MADGTGLPVDPPEDKRPPMNNSGSRGPAPPQVRRWSWGAFFLHWIWGIGNNVWIAFLVFVLPLLWHIVLGIKGNEWAWQYRRFESYEQFNQVQAAWAKWGLILFIVGVVGPSIVLLLTLWRIGFELAR